MKISCIAIDDEPLALDIIREYTTKIPYLNLMATFDNAIESIDFLKSNTVDLLFLDIQMDELTGIQLLNILKTKPLVIFTTAYDSYAVQGYELDAVDYLLKPISFERFMKAVEKVYERMNKKEEPAPVTASGNSSMCGDDYFFVKTEFRLERLKFSEVLYIEGMGDYLMIHTSDKKIMTLQNFKKVEELLPENNFCRVHKSYLVAMDKIECIERNRIKIGNTLIPVSDSYKKVFYDLIEKRGLV
ncbi:MAG: response regulator transcription factor [Bacteroidota bacterium]|nr:response regulator transcription factor [Bacteroidota bacterium]